MRILVVEDDSATRSAMQKFLEFRGHRVATAASAAEASRAAESLDPNVLISDWKLKGARDGVQVAAALAEGHELAVIMVTAHRLDRLKRRISELDVTVHACRRKPVSITELVDLAESLAQNPVSK